MLSPPSMTIVRSPSPKAYQAMVNKFAREGLDYETVWSQVSEKSLWNLIIMNYLVVSYSVYMQLRLVISALLSGPIVGSDLQWHHEAPSRKGNPAYATPNVKLVNLLRALLYLRRTPSRKQFMDILVESSARHDGRSSVSFLWKAKKKTLRHYMRSLQIITAIINHYYTVQSSL